jgi:hypothetical protein
MNDVRGRTGPYCAGREQRSVWVQEYDGVEQVPDTWLQCVVAGQYFADRLLCDMAAVQVHINFWKARLRSGAGQGRCGGRRGVSDPSIEAMHVLQARQEALLSLHLSHVALASAWDSSHVGTAL